MNYETVLIIDGSLDEAVKDGEIGKVTALIGKSGEVKNINKWGKRRLAYPIKKKTHGDYTIITYTGDNTLVREIESGLRINENALRYLTVRL
ncbi:MAG: 30S ribosomal protein S6 [Candidatus Raymondbacteria bacterium RifOxyA12_full_50_37]|uniref:Small ribosomal subunit protein bS6 n=1 Tax=Candidatus Raymondbacteria bacterium RIFOXYD12_FULL_49_13 TaxID=1817890 RepID=A0A1F7F5Q9_UNCRA|nr:MAG: 30S ribosomal protein S6 [Candidatus Raymondbacteria bacterium RifOxyA12_full_50_37]OGJ89242.1 MAG: 30S ribosomal protein S6 [Candidatus Raymondbacteria bacterium RIFOXYA2_FULL_49_16]OGJ97408.1 MAG: 30S ribosomal protein S6 [Candidatus Raymondbacteria bacterium RIFOXYC2_FULL_50_21]OGJ99878.1 MAG: 30S ribosomal protein S6 [Candidatus Raymondbacteria bacterium RifOxyB12_full_50_8]OGK01923.1 MAG: 30S ribosomal protein S6 [Candidatus Raymondbacteria bacterium RIFOXYD12_FULL_49_13]OGP42617.